MEREQHRVVEHRLRSCMELTWNAVSTFTCSERSSELGYFGVLLVEPQIKGEEGGTLLAKVTGVSGDLVGCRQSRTKGTDTILDILSPSPSLGWTSLSCPFQIMVDCGSTGLQHPHNE